MEIPTCTMIGRSLCNGRAQIGCSRAGSVCVVYGAGDGAGDGGGESRTRDDESSGWESGHAHCLKWGIGLSGRRRSCGGGRIERRRARERARGGERDGSRGRRSEGRAPSSSPLASPSALAPLPSLIPSGEIGGQAHPSMQQIAEMSWGSMRRRRRSKRRRREVEEVGGID